MVRSVLDMGFFFDGVGGGAVVCVVCVCGKERWHFADGANWIQGCLFFYAYK